MRTGTAAVLQDRGVGTAGVFQGIGEKGHTVEALAFSADGTQFAAGGVGGLVTVYSTDGGNAIANLEVPGTVFALGFRPDGKQLAVAGRDGKVRLFELPGGKLVKEFVPVPLSGAAKPKE